MAYLGKTPSQAVRSRYYFTASGSETSLSPSEVTGLSFTDANYVDVSLNGVALVSGTDYTATPSTNTISSLSALTASDVVEIVVYDTFSVFGGSVNGDFNISGGTLAAEAVTVTSLDVDNLRLDGNTISSTDTNGNIIIDPDGTGHLLVNNTSFGSNGTLVIQQTADSKGIAIIDSAAANTFFLENDGTINRIRNNASVPLTLETAGSERVRVDASGNVGIGTNSPNTKLHVAGNLTIENTSNAPFIDFVESGDNTDSKARIKMDQVSGTAGQLQFFTEGSGTLSERMRIDSSGRVMIGTTTEGDVSADDLTVAGSANTGITIRAGTSNSSSIYMSDATSGAGEYAGYIAYGHNSNSMSFGTSSASRMIVDSSGNVGIGTSNPSGRLHAQMTHTSTDVTAANSNETLVLGNSGSGNGVYNAIRFGGNQQDMYIMSFNNNTKAGRRLGFFVGSVAGDAVDDERLSIIGNGDVTIGNYDDNGATGGLLIEAGATEYALRTSTTLTSSRIHYDFRNTNGRVGSIATSGSSTSYSTSSDHRLKENVADMTGAITRVKALAPKRFNFIVDTTDTLVDGFLAHEAQTVVPEAVTGTHNEVETWTQQQIDDGDAPDGTSAGDNKLDGDGNTIPVMQGIDQAKLVPLLTGALREAITKIEALETSNADLIARITTLENA